MILLEDFLASNRDHPVDRETTEPLHRNSKPQGHRPSAASPSLPRSEADTPRLPAALDTPRPCEQEVVAPAVDFLRLAGQSRSGYISPGAYKERLRKREYPTAALLHRSTASPSGIPYAELRTASAFSFLDGASLPEDLVQRAAELDLPAVALLDRNGVYGAPRFYQAARQAGIKAIVGAAIVVDLATLPVVGAGLSNDAVGTGPSNDAVGAGLSNDAVGAGLAPAQEGARPSSTKLGDVAGAGPSNDIVGAGLAPAQEGARPSPTLPGPRNEVRLSLLVRNRQGYRNLCRLLTAAAQGQPQGRGPARLVDIGSSTAEGTPLSNRWRRGSPGAHVGEVSAPMRPASYWCAYGLPSEGHLHVELQRHHHRREEHRNRALMALARSLRLPLVATNGVRYARPADKEPARHSHLYPAAHPSRHCRPSTGRASRTPFQGCEPR